MNINYAEILRSRYEQAISDREEVVPLSLTEYRARQGIETWRARMAEHLRLGSNELTTKTVDANNRLSVSVKVRRRAAPHPPA